MLCAVGWGVLACPRCGERFRLIALIEEPRVIRIVLGHLGLPIEVPAVRPADPVRAIDRIEDDIAVV